MHVQKYWQQKISELQAELKHETSQQLSSELFRKIQWMQETKMAVVIYQSGAERIA
ncbi:MAG: hypothetical protein IKA22_12170 [Lentisphaeria bacterium]|nr:hypothetical protein [Lentisphaeria bacterium]